MSARLSVDIGGTFTDVAFESDAELTTTKVLTTYSDPAAGVMQGIDEVLKRSGGSAQDVSLVLHGTTLATNALIQRRGAPTALLTTQGHRDVLEMALENRFEQYDVNIDRPVPLVPRHWRVGVRERTAADGEILLALDEEQVLEVTRVLVAQGVQALAIGFLHSYVRPDHERRAADLIAAEFPDLALTLSCEVCPEIREYERFSTTCANAYVQPLMARYLASLQTQLRGLGVTGDVLLMTSGGGLTTLETAARYPIRLVESGPAGGAMLAADIARSHGLDRVVSFDMGGTTAKICLIDGGEPLHSRAFEVDRSYRFKKGSGLPVRIPVIEMVEIGAGGGSIAMVDGMRRLLVGPDSAGSEPGPACYGRGGTQPAVTDADVVLGKLSAAHFAGGRMQLDVEAAHEVVKTGVGEPLGMSTSSAAHAIAEIVEENMASAARAHAAEWGKDLQDRTLIAFGGAAPLHAASLARRLKIGRVLVPPGAGVGSALGFLLAPVRFEVVRSHYVRLTALRNEPLQAMFEDMRTEAAAVLDSAGAGPDRDEQCHAYMRYIGQGYEIAVPVVPDALATDDLHGAFETAYRALYGRTIPDMPVEVLSWTLALTSANASVRGTLSDDASPVPVEDGQTGTYFDGSRALPMKVVNRRGMQTDHRQAGPLLVVEAQTATVVPPDMQVTRLEDGVLSIDLAAPDRETAHG